MSPLPEGTAPAAMDDESVEAAARHLHALRVSGRTGARLAPALRPASPADGWRIQQRASALQGRPVLGWKCGLPAADRWVVAALHEVQPAGARVQAPAGPGGEPRIEPELAFELQHDLPPRPQPYGTAEVDAAIGAVRLAVEVLGCRYQEAGAASGPELMADGLWHQTLVLGLAVRAAVPAAFALTLALPDRLPATRDARHVDVDPRRPLYWLAEFLRGQGVGLAAGQVVITGSLASVIECPFGVQAVLRYGALGELALGVDPL